MEFGVCGDLEREAVAAESGYDFMESTVGAVLVPDRSEEEFLANLEAFQSADLTFPVLNIFVPGKLKITGPDADLAALEAFVTIVMARAETAGIDTIVFGSGGARRIPDGFDRGEAHKQLVAFCRMVGPIAARHGVTVPVEPLFYGDCNVLNTISECGEFVKEVDHPNIRLLVDSYHMMKNEDSFEDIVAYRDLLAHIHVATAPKRKVPGGEKCDLDKFFKALADAGYDGRVSIEGKIEDPEAELPPGLSAMHAYMDVAKGLVAVA